MATATATSTPDWMSDYLSQNQPNQANYDQPGQMATAVLGKTKVPDQSETIKAAQGMVKTLPGYSRREGQTTGSAAVGQAAIAGFQSQVQAGQQQQEIQGQALQAKADATTKYLKGLDSSATAAIKAQQQFQEKMNQLSGKAEQDKGSMIAHAERTYQDIKDYTAQLAKTNDVALVRSLESSNYSLLQTSKAQERDILERNPTEGKASAEYVQFADQKRSQFAALAGDLISKSWGYTQQILNTGLGAAASMAQTMETNVSYATKYALEVTQAAELAKQQYAVQTLSYVDVVQGLRYSAASEYADWIDQSRVTAVDATPLLSLLLELQQQDQATQPTTSWKLNVPASWSQGMTSATDRKVA
jgi:hypothetical protein